MPIQIFRKDLSTKTKIQAFVLLAVIIAAIVYVVWDVTQGGPLMSLLSNREEVIRIVQSWGIFGPLAYILLQVVQTVVAPIPAQVIAAIGGFLFGWWGILWTTIGTALGCWLVFLLSRRFGRPLIEKIFSKEAVEKFDFVTKSDRATFILFAIFLIPGLPDDLVCYLAGLTDVPIKKLIALVVIGRLPAIVVTNIFGTGLSENNPVAIIVAIVISILAIAIVYFKRKAIMKFLKSKAK